MKSIKINLSDETYDVLEWESGGDVEGFIEGMLTTRAGKFVRMKQSKVQQEATKTKARSADRILGSTDLTEDEIIELLPEKEVKEEELEER